MKKSNITILISFLASFFMLQSCIDNDPVLFSGSVVEFDAAVWNTPATGQVYPILTRVPGYGRAISTNATAPSTADPLITRTSGNIEFRVNLVSAQKSEDQSISVSVVAEKSTAISGTHFTIPSTITIPANSSFGILTVAVINPGATSGSVDLVVQLDGNSTIKPSENYKQIGIRIAQN